MRRSEHRSIKTAQLILSNIDMIKNEDCWLLIVVVVLL